jgi:hypothetical protein
MMKLHLIRIFILALPALPLSEAARADTLQLSKIDRKIESHIRRGNTKKNVQCLAFILKDFQERKIQKSDIYVTFDDPNIDGIGTTLAKPVSFEPGKRMSTRLRRHFSKRLNDVRTN